ncbi:MAG: polysaccharide biosynthesis C-terminal domain-containing protein, partial [Bacteroidota bacterium]
FIYVQAVAGFILLPYVKNLYRLPDRTIHKISWLVFRFGILVVAGAIPAIWAVLTYGYHFSLDWSFFALGAVFILPVFFYSAQVYLLYKHNRQQRVLLANMGGILLNFGLNVLLIPRLGLQGALIATASAQLLTAVLIVLYVREARNLKAAA